MSPTEPESTDTPSDDKGSRRAPSEAFMRPVSRRWAAVWNLIFTYGDMTLTIVRNIALVPLYVKYIGTLEYGAWLSTGAVLMQLTSIDFGLMGVLRQQVASAYGKRDQERLENLIGTGLVVALLVALIMGGLAAALAPVVPRMIEISDDIGHRLMISFLIVGILNALELLALSAGGVLKSLQRTILPGSQRMLAEIASLSLTTYLVIKGWGLYGIVLGLLIRSTWNAAATVIGCFWTCLVLLRIRPRWHRASFATLWSLSIHLFFAQIASKMKSSLDPFFVSVFMGPQVAAAYVLTLRAAEMVRMIVAAIGSSLNPSLSHLFGEGNESRFREIIFARFRVELPIAIIGVGGYIAFNQGFVNLWVGEALFAGHAVVILGGMWVFAFLASIVSYDGMLCRGEFRTINRIVWFEAVVRFPLVVGLLYVFGLWGVPAAALFSQVFAYGVPMTWSLIKRLETNAAELKRLAGRLARSVLVLLLPSLIFATLLKPAPDWFGFGWRAAVFVVMALGIAAMLDRPIVTFLRRRGQGAITTT